MAESSNNSSETDFDQSPTESTASSSHLTLLHPTSTRNGLIRIDFSHENPAISHQKFPKDRRKALLSLVLLVFAGCLNDLVLAYVHEKVPETPPLPDVFFSNIPYLPWALIAAEYLMLTSFGMLLLLGLFHKHRWIVLRRVGYIGAILYFGRAISMYVTQVPVADPKFYCAPKLGKDSRSFSLLFYRALNLVSGFGLEMNGRQNLCGDYIYSGHTLVLVSSYLFIKEYSPRRWWLLHWISFFLSSGGVFLLLLSRAHYTVDILIAYWITTRIFWIYHTIAANPGLRDSTSSHNMLTNLYWFRIFRYMEGSVNYPVPRKFGWPFSWPPVAKRRAPKTNLH